MNNNFEKNRDFIFNIFDSYYEKFVREGTWDIYINLGNLVDRACSDGLITIEEAANWYQETDDAQRYAIRQTLIHRFHNK